jgi:hypothetical protein
MCGAGQPFFTNIDGFFCRRLIIWQKPCYLGSIIPHFPLLNRACALANIITGRGQAGSLESWIIGKQDIWLV